MMIAPQQAPEWLRPLLIILPASHLRPIDKKVSVDSRRNGKLDSSGEEMEATEAGSAPGNIIVFCEVEIIVK
jgi:hypothetical protein